MHTTRIVKLIIVATVTVVALSCALPQTAEAWHLSTAQLVPEAGTFSNSGAESPVKPSRRARPSL